MRGRFAAILAVALLLCGAARADGLYAVEAGPIHALVDARGNEVLAGPGIEAVYAVRAGSLYAAGAPNDYALYGADGGRLGAARFQLVQDAGDALIFRRDGRYGAMDADGGELVSPEWTQLVSNGEGGFLALDGDPFDDLADEVIRVARGAEPVRTGVYTSNGLRAFSAGRMAYAAGDGRYGYLDAEGGEALPTEWMYAGAFDGGAAIVTDGEGFGAIDADGAAIIPLTYAWLARGDGVAAGLRLDGTLELLAPDGTVRGTVGGPVRQAYPVGGFVAVETGERTLLYDADGTCVCQASAEAVFFEGLNGQLIASDGDWGEACQWLVDPDGSAASGLFQRILPLCGDRYAFIELRGVEYYSDSLGGVQTSWDYDSVRYGLMDGRGRVILPAEYREIRAAGEDRLLLVGDGAVTFADPDGAALRVWETAGE